jgi:hypothetical protein
MKTHLNVSVLIKADHLLKNSFEEPNRQAAEELLVRESF